MTAEHDVLRNLSAALLARQTRESRLLLYAVIVSVAWLLLWASFAEIDMITRGIGRIVPSRKVQVVQNLEGGIVSELFVKPGDRVEADAPLLRLENKRFESDLGESGLKIDELALRRARLLAEAGDAEFAVAGTLEAARPDLVRNERSLFSSNRSVRDTQIAIVADQIEQKRTEIADARSRVESLKKNRALLEQQIAVSEPLVRRGIEPRTELLRLEREMLGVKESLASALLTIERHTGAVAELEKKKEDLAISFRTRARKELTEVEGELQRLAGRRGAIEDQVVRTLVRSPVRGVVKTLHVHTVGGVVKPGADLAEIVPADDALVIEAKIRPQDIAFVRPGLPARVKITAYDFAIFGGLTAEVETVSADTLTEPNGATYYLVQLRTERAHLGPEEKPLAILPGMQVSVDILTGKRTILDYLLKPILKARQNALTER